MKKVMLSFVFLFICSSFCIGQEEDYSKYEGFVDFGDFSGLKKSEKSVEIYLKKPLLNLVAALNTEDPSLQQLISNLALIRVEEFEVDPTQNKEVKSVIEKVSNKLKKEKWDTLVKAIDQDERVEIFIKSEEAKITGLLVMAFEGNKEATFINIVGELDLNLLGKLGAKFNIPTLEEAINNQEAETKEGTSHEDD